MEERDEQAGDRGRAHDDQPSGRRRAEHRQDAVALATARPDRVAHSEHQRVADPRHREVRDRGTPREEVPRV